MQDLRELAYKALDVARDNLLQDGFLTPVAFIVKADEVITCGMSFEGQAEKEEVYAKLIEDAREANALAIITVNDSYYRPAGENLQEYLDGYYHGRMAAEGEPECIFVTVSGPAVRNWTIAAYYERNGEKIVFTGQEEEEGTEINFLPGWPQGGNIPS